MRGHGVASAQWSRADFIQCEHFHRWALTAFAIFVLLAFRCLGLRSVLIDSAAVTSTSDTLSLRRFAGCLNFLTFAIFCAMMCSFDLRFCWYLCAMGLGIIASCVGYATDFHCPCLWYCKSCRIVGRRRHRLARRNARKFPT